MSVDTSLDLSVLERLEFAPPCEMRLEIRPDCSETAEWVEMILHSRDRRACARVLSCTRCRSYVKDYLANHPTHLLVCQSHGTMVIVEWEPL